MPCRQVLGRKKPGLWGRRNVVQLLRHELFSGYRKRASTHRGENLTRLADLTPSMLGNEGNQKLETKAAETFGVLVCLSHIIPKYYARFPPHSATFLQATRALLLIVDRFRNSPTNMLRETLEEVLHTYVRCVAGSWPDYIFPSCILWYN